MSQELDKAIESLEVELQNITLRATEIKRTINQLLFLNGAGPRYADIENDSPRQGDVKGRQFVSKGMLDSVKEVLRMRGKNFASAQEVLTALEKGDFLFPEDWKKKLKLKNMAIFLGSNKNDFVWFDTKAGKVYALAEQYPERRKDLDKTAKDKNDLAGPTPPGTIKTIRDAS